MFAVGTRAFTRSQENVKPPVDIVWHPSRCCSKGTICSCCFWATLQTSRWMDFEKCEQQVRWLKGSTFHQNATNLLQIIRLLWQWQFWKIQTLQLFFVSRVNTLRSCDRHQSCVKSLHKCMCHEQTSLDWHTLWRTRGAFERWSSVSVARVESWRVVPAAKPKTTDKLEYYMTERTLLIAFWKQHLMTASTVGEIFGLQ